MRELILPRDFSIMKELESNVRNKFRLQWLYLSVTLKTKSGDVSVSISDSIVKVNIPGKVLCTFCSDLINYAGRGKSAIIEHMGCAKHVAEVEHRRRAQYSRSLEDQDLHKTEDKGSESDMSNRSVQRARKPNYTKEETDTLLNQLILYGHFLFNKNQPVNNQQKADVWANIAMQVNAVPNSAGRTVDELKHRWQDMAQRARHALRKTPFKPVPFLNKILQVLGESQVKSQQQDDTMAAGTSVDSTHSSDSSFVANVKDELNEAYQNTSAVDLSQNNGASRSNDFKRSYPYTLITTMSGETEQLDDDSSRTHHIPNDNRDDSNAFQDQFESKRRRMKKNSNPRKSVSVLTYDDQKDNTNDNDDNVDNDTELSEGVTIQHKHIETFRSMVLDPDSEIVMEVEGTADNDGDATDNGDGDSTCSSVSASNLSSTPNNHFEINNVDKIGSNHNNGRYRQQLKDEAVGSQYNPSPVNTIVNSNHQVIHRNGKQSSNLPTFLVNNKNRNVSSFPPSYQRRRGSQQPPPDIAKINTNHYHHQQSQQQQWKKLDLESMSKAELDRRCIISQIQMQEQHTRYLMLKEQKVQLEIEALKGKCLCGNSSDKTSNNEAKSSQEILMPSSSSTLPLEKPLERVGTSSLPVSSVPLSRPDVASFKTSEISENFEARIGISKPKVRNEIFQEGRSSEIEEIRSSETDNGHSNTNLENEDSKNNNDVSDDNYSNDKNNNDEGNDEDVAMMVSFGDDDDDGGDDNDEDCVISENMTKVDNLFGSESKSGEDWEKNLQENIGL